MPLKIKSSGSYYATIDDSALTADRIYSLPNIAGSLLTSTITQNVTVSGSNLTVSGSILMSGSLNTPVFAGYQERLLTSSASAYSGGIVNPDLDAGNVFRILLDGNVTSLTPQNAPDAGLAAGFTIVLVGDGTGRTVDWGSQVVWAGGYAPGLVSGSGNIDVYAFVAITNSKWLGTVIAQNKSGLT